MISSCSTNRTRVAVLPAYQGRGIGRRLVAEVERRFPQARRFELFTGARSVENIRLYERLGYRRERTETLSAAVELVHLAKER